MPSCLFSFSGPLPPILLYSWTCGHACGCFPPSLGSHNLRYHRLHDCWPLVAHSLIMWLTMSKNKLRLCPCSSRALVLVGGWGILKHQPSSVQRRSKNLLSDFFLSCLTIVHTPALNNPLSEAGPRPLLSPCTHLQCKRLRPVRSHRRHARAEARVLLHRQAYLPHKSPPSRSTGTEAP